MDRALLEESQILKATKQLASLESLAELDSLNTKWGIILDGNVETKMGATSQSSQSKKRPLEEPVGEIAVKKPRIDLTIPVVRASENGANVPKSILSTPNHSGGKKKVSFRDDNLVQERVLSKWLQVGLRSRAG